MSDDPGVRLPLTNGMSTLVSECDVEKIGGRRLWLSCWAIGTRIGYVRIRTGDGYSHPVRLHRFILDAPKGVPVDHRNGDTLDNRRSNIRICTTSQNNINSRRGANVAGYRGVTKNRSRFDARIRINGKMRRLGGFDTPEEAARAYDAAAYEKSPAFCILNFPRDLTTEPAND